GGAAADRDSVAVSKTSSKFSLEIRHDGASGRERATVELRENVLRLVAPDVRSADRNGDGRAYRSDHEASRVARGVSVSRGTLERRPVARGRTEALSEALTVATATRMQAERGQRPSARLPAEAPSGSSKSWRPVRRQNAPPTPSGCRCDDTKRSSGGVPHGG